MDTEAEAGLGLAHLLQGLPLGGMGGGAEALEADRDTEVLGCSSCCVGEVCGRGQEGRCSSGCCFCRSSGCRCCSTVTVAMELLAGEDEEPVLVVVVVAVSSEQATGPEAAPTWCGETQQR